MTSDGVETHLRASENAQRAGDFDAMLAAARRAGAPANSGPRARFRLLECLLYCGQVAEAREQLTELERTYDSDHRVLVTIAEFHTHCADHDAALRCYERALALAPDNPNYHAAASAALVATGNIPAAEARLRETLRLNPADCEAWRNLVTLRRQDGDDAPVETIEALLSDGRRKPGEQAQLCYALAKCCEDIGEFDRSFDWLQRGADARRSVLQYRVEEDVAVMQRLIAVFDNDYANEVKPACEEEGPVFIVGLPRSGTTLVDRILSSHSQVDSLGEINSFAYALMHEIGRSADKLTLIDASTSIDPASLGRRYVDAIRQYGKPGPYLIDKTPLNYLYVGLIRRSMPNARIVHVEREPMDSLYGMYRMLFRAGYPFSYDFADLGAYYVAYRRLVQHWREMYGDAVYWLSYEQLVDDQEGESRRLLRYCGLDWEPACLDFHLNTSPVATASSTQVRQPVHRRAIGRWKQFERQLAPLRDYLEEQQVLDRNA